MNQETKEYGEVIMGGKDKLFRTYNLRCYPNDEQKAKIEKTFCYSAHIYNYYLDKLTKDLKQNIKPDMWTYIKDLSVLRRNNKKLLEVDYFALKGAIIMLFDKYNLMKFKDQNLPAYKDTANCHLYRTELYNNNIVVKDDKIMIPLLAYMPIKYGLYPTGDLVSAEVKKSSTEKYYVSLKCRNALFDNLGHTGKVIGIDLGVTYFAVLSDGTYIENPKFLLESYEKEAKLQQKMSRAVKYSLNWHKYHKRFLKVREHTLNCEKDFLDKLTYNLVLKYDVICIESLDIKKLVKGQKLAKSILASCWGKFIEMLIYKARAHNKVVVKVPMWYKSSKTCSNCGHIEEEMGLEIREWDCPKCGCHHNRDHNAAVNIKNEGLKLYKLKIKRS